MKLFNFNKFYVIIKIKLRNFFFEFYFIGYSILNGNLMKLSFNYE